MFNRMLDHNMTEARMGEVDIVDVDHDTLNKMLQFIYTGQETTFECQTSGKSCVFEYFPSNRLKMKTSLQSFSTPLTNMSLAPL